MDQNTVKCDFEQALAWQIEEMNNFLLSKKESDVYWSENEMLVPVFVVGNGVDRGSEDREGGMAGDGGMGRVIEFAERKGWDYGFSYGNDGREEVLGRFARIC